MSNDHNEAMRLADRISHETDWYELDQVTWYNKAAALLRELAERIAELEARVHTCGPTCSKAGCINRRLTAECDTLRAEVERLKRENAHAIDKAGHMLAAGMCLSNCAFNLKQRVGETLSTHDVAALDSSQRAWDIAIDTARKAAQ